MKLKFALVGLAAFGGAALSTESASAMPIGLTTSPDIASNIDQVRLVCNAYGRSSTSGAIGKSVIASMR